MTCKIEKWELSYAKQLAESFSDKKIHDNLRDGLPFPYTEADGLDFISAMLAADKNDTFAFAITLGFLLFFKYTNFFLSNINALLGTSLPLLSSSEFHLPLGISFYTFQIMAYTIDVYRRKIKVEHNLIDFGTFVVLFPQLIAGPIVLYSDISRELKHRKITLEQINDGAGLFIMGLASKILLADTIGRTMAAPYEISATIIMSVAGGPFFILLLRRSKKYAG